MFYFDLTNIISRTCGRGVCSACSSKTIQDNRVCDICFYKADNRRAEARRKDQLKSKEASIETYMRQLEREKDDLNDLIIRKAELEKKVSKFPSL
jgi:hypothetical protein